MKKVGLLTDEPDELAEGAQRHVSNVVAVNEHPTFVHVV